MEFVSPAVSDIPFDHRLDAALAALAREGLRERGQIRLRLQGDSMWPTIPAGSLVEVVRTSADDLKVGDIVVWQRRGVLIAHRIVEKAQRGSDTFLVTKGDNSAASDRLLSQNAILGRVVAIYGPDQQRLRRNGRPSRVEAVFWMARWRVRSLLGALGRLLPDGLQKPLVRFRDRLGLYLSRGFRSVWLR
jgi:signal peptidase I